MDKAFICLVVTFHLRCVWMNYVSLVKMEVCWHSIGSLVDVLMNEWTLKECWMKLEKCPMSHTNTPMVNGVSVHTASRQSLIRKIFHNKVGRFETWLYSTQSTRRRLRTLGSMTGHWRQQGVSQIMNIITWRDHFSLLSLLYSLCFFTTMLQQTKGYHTVTMINRLLYKTNYMCMNINIRVGR